MNLGRILHQKGKVASISTPQIFDPADAQDRRKLSRLFSRRSIAHLVDDYKNQLCEYFQVSHPRLVYTPLFEEAFQNYIAALVKKSPLWRQGRWVFFPWLSILVHILEDKSFQLVRTARNRNLITAEEQEKFYNSVIGIAGLSVGNSVALAIALQSFVQFSFYVLPSLPEGVGKQRKGRKRRRGIIVLPSTCFIKGEGIVEIGDPQYNNRGHDDRDAYDVYASSHRFWLLLQLVNKINETHFILNAKCKYQNLK